MKLSLLLAAGIALSGCASVPAAVIGAGLGFGASALKLDDDIFQYWAAHRTAAPPSGLVCPSAEGVMLCRPVPKEATP